jgi:hypothetical protein
LKSFIIMLRDECLNQNWFIIINEARDFIEEWRMDYNG